MSLKSKVSLIMSLLFFVSGAAGVAVNRLVIMPSFLELERDQAQRNVERAVEALQRDLDVLSTNVTAWAWWDESKRYMEGQNDEFVQRELSADPVSSAEVSYMGFYRTTGSQVIHRAPAAAEPDSAGLGQLQDASLPAGHPLLWHADVRGDAKGFVSTPTGPMLVASRPILNSSGEGPPAGVLIFGRLLDAATVERIASQAKLELTITPVVSTQPQGTRKRRSAPAWKRGQPARIDVRPDQTGSNLTGETTIADVHGNPILTLRVMTPRAISARGEEASRIALATLCAVALAVLGVLLALVHVTVLGPIVKLTAHAVNVGANDALHERLKLERNDELGVLAAEFNRMTDRLVEARRRLVDQSFVSGKADMAAGILHNLGNAVTPIMVRLNTLSDRLKAAPLDDLEGAVRELEGKAAASERQADLLRFVQLASLDLASLMRDTQEDVCSVGVQVEHVQQILTEQVRYSRAGGIVEAVDIEQAILQAADALNPELQSAATLDVDPSVRVTGAVRGRRVEIQQVVGNLILNAAESIRSRCIAGGRIGVRAVREEANGAAVAHLIFEDNGAGIQPSHLGRIFERRFSTKKRGSGLGLHWSANTVAALGGNLFAESSGEGRGASLHLILPIAEDLSGASNSAAAG
jgi:two-component system, NtrC family, sensor kinase